MHRHPRKQHLLLAALAGALAFHPLAAAPLKVYLMSGQSNMQGFCSVHTFPTPTGFDFTKPTPLTVAGDDSRMCKFGHVLRDADGWHLFYSNYDDGHGRNSVVRYANSDDGIRWQARNKGLIKGLDADVLRVADALYLMVYAPQGGFDANGTDIRLAVYNGRLPDLAKKPPLVPQESSSSTVSPINKLDVGYCLARWARPKDHGQAGICVSKPLYKKSKVEGGAVRIEFAHAKHLKSRDCGPLRRFGFAGQDRKWHWAKATIEGGTVSVSGTDVPQPVAMRCGWAANPVGANLLNGDGPQASLFRTGACKLMTEKQQQQQPK